jgi:regulator of protease activity HflC (stomatin/prohibitin superfamily)
MPSIFDLLMIPVYFLGFILCINLLTWIRKLDEYERGVVFRLGRLVSKPVGPGLTVLWFPPLVDRMVRVDLRTLAMDVPSQDVITRDNVSIKVNAVLYYKVFDPILAVNSIQNYDYATSQMAQTTLRSVIGQLELDEFLSHQEKVSDQLQAILDRQTEPWGIKVTNVEVNQIDLPPDMQRAMARQAEAERERRAKIISAEGEFQAAEKLVEAAKLMEMHPGALQMRYLQTMVEVGSENSSTIMLPFPIEFLQSFAAKKN